MSKALRILVVDDERMYRTLLEKTLTAEEYLVETAGDGREAIDRISRTHFDIVLTDLAMPNISGIEVLKAAKAKDATTVVVIITGFASLDTALAAIRDGVYDYITKPFQIEEIRLTIANARDRILLERESAQLAAKLSKAYEMIESLTQNKQEFDAKVLEIEAQLASRQQTINEGMKRLRGFHDRVLPVQFRVAGEENGSAGSSNDAVVQKLREATQLHKQGMIDDDEFRLLKKRILGN
ncbi:MAG: response regulator [Candidatus Lernaella stagnicola]|nr:response regulator [Candidatus Lernaella stagnicola]